MASDILSKVLGNLAVILVMAVTAVILIGFCWYWECSPDPVSVKAILTMFALFAWAFPYLAG